MIFFSMKKVKEINLTLNKTHCLPLEGTSGIDVIWLLDGRWKPDEESDL